MVTNTRDLRALLREFVGLCVEAAATPGTASESGLALFIGRSPYGSKVYILYDPKVREKVFAQWLKGVPREELSLSHGWMKHFKDHAHEVFTSGRAGILGHIETVKNEDPCHGGEEVHGSAAVGGYGPMLYDVAMAGADNKTLFADRGSISKDAVNVWNFYRKNRRDVKKMKFDDVKDPKTPPPDDDCEMHGPKYDFAIDYAYKASKSPNVAALRGTHEGHIRYLGEMIEIASRGEVSPEDVAPYLEKWLRFAGEDFFGIEFRSKR